MNFAENLRELRRQRNLKKKDLAADLHISLRALGYYESGEREPQLSLLVKMADYFAISLDELAGRTFPPAGEKERTP